MTTDGCMPYEGKILETSERVFVDCGVKCAILEWTELGSLCVRAMAVEVEMTENFRLNNFP